MSALRGSLTARPCAGSELARFLRAILRTFPTRPHRGRGGPRRSKEADILSAEADASLRSPRKSFVIPAKAGIQLFAPLGLLILGPVWDGEGRTDKARA